MTSLTKFSVVPLLIESVEELLTRPEVIVNGFRYAGIVPWDPSAVNKKKMIPSSVFAKPSIEVESVEETVDTTEGTSSKPGTSAQMFVTPSSEVQSIEMPVDPIQGTSSVKGPSAQMCASPSNEVESVERSQDLLEVISSEPRTSAPMAADSQPSSSFPLSSGSPAKVSEPIMDDELPQFTPRNLLQFETIFMTERQVAKCEDMFARKVKSSNPIFLAWKVFKSASLPTEKVALEAVI